MPWASAPNAPCVEVWLSPQTMVVPGSVKPCSGPTTWTMPWRLSSSLIILDAEVAGILGQRLHLGAAFDIIDAVRAVGRGHVVVDDGQGFLRGMDLPTGHAEAFEGLRARDLVDEVTVDVEQAGAVGLAVDDVVVEDLVVQGLRCGVGHGARGAFQRCECCGGLDSAVRRRSQIGQRPGQIPRAGCQAGSAKKSRARGPACKS